MASHVCRYCGATEGLTKEHLVPKCRGGDKAGVNVGLSCGTCNNAKGPLNDDEFMILKDHPEVLSRLRKLIGHYVTLTNPVERKPRPQAALSQSIGNGGWADALRDRASG